MREIYKDQFSTFHPITNMVFFLGAILMGMFFIHPAFVALSILISVTYLLTLKKTKAFKELLYMLFLFVLLSVINPVFDRLGATVLFELFGRPYTLEALIYGMTLGGMAIAVLCWFACYNAIMTSDKFIYIFGRIMPSISMILSMILRLIPNFAQKTRQISDARSSIGLARDTSANRKEKMRNGALVLSALAGWALEGGIITADSMQSRGYGTGKRTSFAKHRFDARNNILLVFMGVLIVLIIFCAVNGSTKAEYVPYVTITWFGNIYMLTGMIAYGLFLVLPAALQLKETVKWKILRSRM
ncbi:MAG: energy-coupling factor transporter transmembrane protein EcfT [Parasporobacterium sp.]|nr:energy-coupling factor transporter transmembrane protein EcfT [Parasporobacterium sp.]